MQRLEQQSLEAFLGLVAATHPGCTLSLCLEGLHSYLRRAYTSLWPIQLVCSVTMQALLLTSLWCLQLQQDVR